MCYDSKYYLNRSGKFPLKSILTEYDGISYRSRTEARVAILLDLLCVPFSYEKEGYYLHDGHSTYSPDFSIRDNSIKGAPEHFYVEVKGEKAPRRTTVQKDFVQYKTERKIGMTASVLILSDLPYGLTYADFLLHLARLYGASVQRIGDGSIYGTDLISGIERPGLALLAVNKCGKPQLYNITDKAPADVDVPATLAAYTVATSAKFDRTYREKATIGRMMEQKEETQKAIEREDNYYGRKSVYRKAFEEAGLLKSEIVTA